MRVAIWLSIFLLLAGCASQKAVFISEPPGATVTVNGDPVGVTPCSLEYQNCSGGTFEVKIERQGFEPVYASFEADEVDQEARSSWVAAGVVWSPLWIGTLFTNKFKDSYEFVLKPEPYERTARH